MSDAAGQTSFKLFWGILAAGMISLIGGGTLFILNQSTPGGASGQLGPGHTDETYAAGEPVGIWRNESWHPGNVLEVDGSRYRVQYENTQVFAPEWVGASRLQHRQPSK